MQAKENLSRIETNIKYTKNPAVVYLQKQIIYYSMLHSASWDTKISEINVINYQVQNVNERFAFMLAVKQNPWEGGEGQVASRSRRSGQHFPRGYGNKK